MSTYENNLTPIRKLYTSISKWIDEAKYSSFFLRICDEFDLKCEKDLNKNHWQNSLIRKLLQVHERLLLTDTISEDIGDNFLKRYMYPQLITYLRLTCFDQLGQPGNWMIFSDWLTSKKKKVEREQVVKNIANSDNLEFTKNLFLKYQEIYGVKNSFFNFLSSVISQHTKAELLNLIRIKIYNGKNIGRDATDKDKEDYLFKIRNDFTHNTYSTSPMKKFQNKKDSEWNFRETIYKDKETFWISTHKDFEEKLKETILIGITEVIKRKEHGN